MKGYVLNPLALLGAQLGYNRPLDRHDWDGKGGHVPGWAGCYLPGVGETRRFSNLNSLMEGAAVAYDMYSFDSVQRHPLGTIAVTKDGRVLRYSQAGDTLLVVGNLLQGIPKVTAHLANTPPAVAIGATSFTYTPGAATGVANLYAEGVLMVDTTPGNGYTYRVSGHPAIASSTAFTLTLDPDDAIQVALTASSRVGLHTNVWKLMVQCPTAITARVAGFCVSPMAINNYGWVQTRGPVAALINGTPAITSPVANSATTAGAVDVWTTAAAAVTITPVGYMMQVGVSTKNNAVFATID
jgi:hypothetical protein